MTFGEWRNDHDYCDVIQDGMAFTVEIKLVAIEFLEWTDLNEEPIDTLRSLDDYAVEWQRQSTDSVLFRLVKR